MAPPPKDVTFIGWIEDIINIPKEIKNKTWAVVKTAHNQYLVVQTAVYAPSAGISDADFVAALVEGDESVDDIKGVNTVVKLTDLVKEGPWQTTKTLGKKTIDNILRVDDIGQDRRRRIVSQLLNGELKDKDTGRDLDEPQNLTLQFLDKSHIFPLTKPPITIDPTGKPRSNIQLLKNLNKTNDPKFDKYEDSMTADEGDPKDRYAQYKTYKSLAGAITKMAGNMESVGPRINKRNEALREYNRTIARELGIDLEKVLDRKSSTVPTGEFQDDIIEVKAVDKRTGRTTTRKVKGPLIRGSFREELIKKGGDVEKLIKDRDAVIRALGISEELYSDIPKSWLHVWMRNEDLQIRNAYRSPFGHTGKKFIDAWERNGLNKKLGKTEYNSKFMHGLVDSDLDHLIGQTGLSAQIAADVNGARIRKLVSTQAKKRAAVKWDAEVKKGIIDPAQITKNSYVTSASDGALKRFKSATNAIEMANGLFFAGTTKDILEAINNGSFVEQLLVTSRVLGTLPFIDKKYRAPSQYATFVNVNTLINKKGLGRAVHAGLDEVKRIPAYLGLNYGPSGKVQKIFGKIPDPLRPLREAFQKRIVSIEWKPSQPPGVSARPIPWKIRTVKAKEAAGIYGNWGVFDVLKRVEDYGLSPTHDPKNLLSFGPRNFSTTRLNHFFENLRKAGLAFQETDPAKRSIILRGVPVEFVDLAKKLGLHDATAIKNFTKQWKAFKKSGQGKDFLIKVTDLMKVKETERWDFLLAIFKQGKAEQFTKELAGILEIWNTYANQFRSYLFKNVIFNPLFEGKFVLGSAQAFIRRMGFSEERTLIETISRWGVIRTGIFISRAFARAIENPLKAIRYIRKGVQFGVINKKLGLYMARFIHKFAGKKVLFTAISWLIKGASGILTGGVGWVLTIFGDAIWKFAKNLILFKPKKAIQESWESIKGIGRTAKKIVLYPIMAIANCIAGCIFIIFIIIILIGSILANLDPLETLGGAVGDIVSNRSNKIEVDKIATLVGNELQYTIKITNITTEDIEIKSFKDNLTYIPPCSETQQKFSEGDTITGIGSGQITSASEIVGKTIAQGITRELTFTIKDIATNKNATFINTVEIKAKGDFHKKAADTELTKIGTGGCAQCPSGWPTSSFDVTQGPETSGSDASHPGEAADLGTNLGIPGAVRGDILGKEVKATHDGIVTKRTSQWGGFGKYIKITSPLGFSTYYAHLSDWASGLKKGDSVNKNQLIGYVGNTGNSDAAHLHYELYPTGIECVTGKPLMLNPPYVPIAIPRGCIGRVMDGGTCDLRVP